MVPRVVARTSALVVDGRPGIWTLGYLAVEAGNRPNGKCYRNG